MKINTKNLKCPNKKCKETIYRENMIGVKPKVLSIGSVYFKCAKCDETFFIHLPIYLVNDIINSLDTKIKVRKNTIDPRAITDKEEKIFKSMIQAHPTEMLEALRQIEPDLSQYENKE